MYKPPTAITDRSETRRLAEKNGISDFQHIDSEAGCFTTGQITIKGNVANYRDNVDLFEEKYNINVFGSGERGNIFNAEGWKKLGATKIPGLKCPYCRADAYETDTEKVATCGACPGWFFFYEGIKHEGDSSTSNKIVMKFINGQLQPVIETDTGVTVGEKKI